MALRPAADVLQRLREQGAEAVAGDTGVDVRAVVRMQNAVDTALAQALRDLEERARRSELGPAWAKQPTSIGFQLKADDARTNSVALREAQERLTHTPGLVDVQITLAQGHAPRATFLLAPNHPTRLRIEELMRGEETDEDRLQRFVADVVAARRDPTLEELASAQDAMARLRMDKREASDTFPYGWQAPRPTTAYFGRGQRPVIDRALAEIGEARAVAALQRLGIEASVRIGGEVTKVWVKARVPGAASITDFRAPPGTPRPDQAVLDAAMDTLARRLDAAVDDLANAEPGRALEARLGGRPSTHKLRIFIPRELAKSNMEFLAVLDELRLALAGAGYDGVEFFDRGLNAHSGVYAEIRLPAQTAEKE